MEEEKERTNGREKERKTTMKETNASETDENITDTLKNTHFSTLTPAKSTCCFVNVPKI